MKVMRKRRYTLVVRLNNNTRINETYTDLEEFNRDADRYSRSSNVLEVTKLN